MTVAEAEGVSEGEALSVTVAPPPGEGESDLLCVPVKLPGEVVMRSEAVSAPVRLTVRVAPSVTVPTALPLAV